MTDPDYIVWNPIPDPVPPINSAHWLGFPAETIEMEKPIVHELSDGAFEVHYNLRFTPVREGETHERSDNA